MTNALHPIYYPAQQKYIYIGKTIPVYLDTGFKYLLFILAVALTSCDVGNGHKQYMAAGIIEDKDPAHNAMSKGYMLRIDNDTAHYWFYSFPPGADVDTTKFPQRILINYTHTHGDKSNLVTIKDMQVRYRDNFGCPIP